MILVERYFVKGNQEIISLCQLSKELYNRTNHFMRQAWFNQQQLPNISTLNKQIKDFKLFQTIS